MNIEIIRKVINDADPIGLLKMGAPKNEYDSEILEIYRDIIKCESISQPKLAAIMYDTFVVWFDGVGVGPYSIYDSMATKILELRK